MAGAEPRLYRGESALTETPHTARTTTTMMGVFDFESARQYVWDSPRLYRQWWLNLVREDPGHVVVETALIAFIVYILFFKRTLNPKVKGSSCVFGVRIVQIPSCGGGRGPPPSNGVQ